VGFGLWGIFVGEVGMTLSVVTGMSFGIVVDNTVHFLSKYLRAKREKNLIPEDAVRYAFRTVGNALVITTSTLIIGFLALATSSFSLNADMGLLTAIVIAVALATVFLLLPPLLLKIEENDSGPSTDASGTDTLAAA
jgi:predicted RND superfamily exporter protein